MPSALFRGSAVLASALLLVLPAAASAADTDEFAAEAATSAVRVSLFEAQTGAPLLDLVGTDAMVSSDPTAEAGIDALTVLGNTVGEVRSASSTGDAARDPGEGDGCTVPVAVTGLTLDAVCSLAAADAGDLASTSAEATAQLLKADVSGQLLAGALSAPLGDIVADVGDVLVEGAIDEFIGRCNELIPDNEADDQIFATGRDLLGMAPEQVQPITDAASDAAGQADSEGYCTAVYNLSVTPLAEGVLDVSAILDALSGVDILSVEVDGADSRAAGGDAGLDATAQQATVVITGPDVLPAVDDTINALVAEIVDAIELIAGGDSPLPLEEFADEIAAALDAIPLFGIEGPLVQATIDGGAATTSLAAADAATTAGGTEPSVALTLAPGLLELFGQDGSAGQLTLSAGQSQVLAEGTPLESSISVGAVTTEDGVTFGDTDLVGSTATASATTVSLLSGVEGGITIVLAESTAGSYGSVLTAGSPDPAPDPLPNTGGGAAAAAVLALAAGAALRRRRD